MKRITTWYQSDAAEDHMSDAHAPMWAHLVSLLPETDLSGLRVLDYGCNQGGFLRQLHYARPFLQGVGVDIAEQSIERAQALKGELPLSYHSDTGLQGLDGQFDLAFSHEVIYLIDDLAEHAANLLRVLKPGGVYYAVTGCHTDNPLWPRWRELVAERTHSVVQDRSLTDYARVFAKAGFEVSARRFAYDGFVAYAPEGWAPDLCDALAYQAESKVMFRLRKPL